MVLMRRRGMSRAQVEAEIAETLTVPLMPWVVGQRYDGTAPTTGVVVATISATQSASLGTDADYLADVQVLDTNGYVSTPVSFRLRVLPDATVRVTTP